MTVAGIDPGSGYAAAAILDGAERPRLVAARTWEVGRLEALAEPVPYTRPDPNNPGERIPQLNADGSPKMRTHRRVSTLHDARNIARDMVAFCVSHGVTHVLLEHAERVNPGATVAATAAMGSELKKSGELEAFLFAAATDAGIAIDTRQAVTVRSFAIGGVVKGRGTRAEEVLSAEVDGWKDRERTDTGTRLDHERDAGVVAYAAWRIAHNLGPRVDPNKPSRKPSVRRPRVPLTREQSKALMRARQARKDARIAERAAEKARRKAAREASPRPETRYAWMVWMALTAEPASVTDLARATGLGDPLVGPALRALRDLGIASSQGSHAWERWTLAAEKPRPSAPSEPICKACGWPASQHRFGHPKPSRAA